jgi:hypothetical protein
MPVAKNDHGHTVASTVKRGDVATINELNNTVSFADRIASPLINCGITAHQLDGCYLDHDGGSIGMFFLIFCVTSSAI